MRTVLLYLTSPHRVWTLDEKYVRILREKFPELRFVVAKNGEESLRHLGETEVFYGWNVPEKHFPEARRLKWLHSAFAGVDEVLHPSLVASDVRVTCSRGVSSAALADHVMGMILTFSRGLAPSIRERAPGIWIRDRYFDGNPMPQELDGRTLGILGYGSIGRELARRGRAFGMRIHAFKRNRIAEDESADRLYGPAEMQEFLGSADYLAVTLPLTRATEAILDEKTLGWIKPGAVLINVARGRLIQEEALVKALESGRLSGAGLDVFTEEPLPAASPLYRLPNVFLTPHIAGLHPHYLDRTTSLFLVNLGRYLQGEPLLHEVDKRSGY